MKISEIFRSIQGESTYAGLPCTFIRTAGCSLRCRYCDTEYALDQNAGEEMSLDSIVSAASNLGLDLVELTGGEPLERPETPELCRILLDKNATVLLETGGAHPIDSVPPDVIKILDVKTPSSRMESRNRWQNLPLLSPHDEIKFVIGSREDFDWSVQVCRDHNLFGRHAILFSPVFTGKPPLELAQWILAAGIPVRLQLQMHKYIWPPDARGV
ncbi:MAG: radical SAM protein [Candidatus Omnitrophica bacterium]|nr:radical SAM protein [Candidatus Omnitrophota bacterium]